MVGRRTREIYTSISVVIAPPLPRRGCRFVDQPFFFSQSVPKAFNMDEIEENDLLSDICTDVSTVSTTFASVASLASEADIAERDAAIDDLLEWLEMQPSWGLRE